LPDFFAAATIRLALSSVEDDCGWQMQFFRCRLGDGGLHVNQSHELDAGDFERVLHPSAAHGSATHLNDFQGTGIILLHQLERYRFVADLPDATDPPE
jgi:hypothetical protein